MKKKIWKKNLIKKTCANCSARNKLHIFDITGKTVGWRYSYAWWCYTECDKNTRSEWWKPKDENYKEWGEQ
jgi:hypothetical protein